MTNFKNLSELLPKPNKNGWIVMTKDNIKELIDLITKIFSDYKVTYNLVSSGELKVFIDLQKSIKIEFNIETSQTIVYHWYILDKDNNYIDNFVDSLVMCYDANNLVIDCFVICKLWIEDNLI